MTKNKLKKLIVCCVILGIAIAGGILYFTKHRNSKKSLEKDFHDFKDAFDEAKEQKEEKPQSQKNMFLSLMNHQAKFKNRIFVLTQK